jgi:hypothetical protein
MKRTLAIVSSVLFLLIIFQTSSLRLTSNSAQPPTPGLSNDPGQTTCNHCHVGNTLIDPGKFTIKLSPDSAGLVGTANVVTSSTQYIPDSTEWVSVELHGTNGITPKYGFQLTALDSVNNLAGTFTLTNTAKTSFQNSAATGRKYVGHKNANGTTTAWSFKWKAPHSGPVTLYYAGNIANGDGVENVAGDSVFASSATITAGPVVIGIADLSPVTSLSAYPMPFSHTLSLEMSLNNAAPLSISLVSMQGEVVRELYNGDGAQGKFDKSFDIADIASGVYLLKIGSNSSSRVIKVMKL